MGHAEQSGGQQMALDMRETGIKAAARNGQGRMPRDIVSLPATVEWLRSEGLLLETEVEVDGDLELTGIQKALDGSYPILFNNVKGYPHARAITNLFANYPVLDRMFGWDGPVDRTKKLAYALTHPIKPVEV